MADEDARRRRRDREDERDEESASFKRNSRGEVTGFTQMDPARAEEKIEELFVKATNLIDKCNGLYQQFVTGIELRPPHEVRKQLESVMGNLTMANKPTQVQRFRFYSLQSRYTTHKERWDKLEKDVENGTIQRTTGPGAGPRRRGVPQ